MPNVTFKVELEAYKIFSSYELSSFS